MTVPSFDSTHAVRFDLATGSVRAAGEEERLILLPAAALANLLLYASADAGVALGRAIGQSVGQRVAARTKKHPEATVEQFATLLAGEAALAGIGVLSLERWGRALVVVVEASPLTAPLLAPMVGAAIDAATTRKVATCLLAHEDGASRVLIGSRHSIERVNAWIASGTPWGAALVKLHGGGA